jgi:hypothetical protein
LIGKFNVRLRAKNLLRDISYPDGPAPSNRITFTLHTPPLLSERVCPRPPPIEQRALPGTRASSSVGARPSSATPVEQRPVHPTHASSSVGARPSPAAPVEQNHLHPHTQALPFAEATVVQPSCYIRARCFCSTGAAEDGRAPTEELACRR